MRQRDIQFAAIFVRLTPVLTRFFANTIRKYGGDGEAKADILVQIVAEQALRDSRLEQFTKYTVEVLIWFKAGNVASAYVQSSRKRMMAQGTISRLTGGIPGPTQYLSFQEVQHHLYKHSDRLTWQICFLIREGWSYHQIAQALDISVDDIMMRLYRLEQELKQRDSRPD